jgi:hypothetical protein
MAKVAVQPAGIVQGVPGAAAGQPHDAKEA